VHRNRTLSRRYIRKCLQCTETERFPDGTLKMCTVHRNRTLSRRYIRNVYVHGKNAIQTVHKKCVLCTETEHFPDCTSEMCIVHRNRTLSRRYIRKCSVHRNKTLSRRYNRNVYCAQKRNTFQTVHIKHNLQITKRHLRMKLSDLQSFKCTNIWN